MTLEPFPIMPDADAALAAAIREVEKRIVAGEKIDWTAAAQRFRWRLRAEAMRKALAVDPGATWPNPRPKRNPARERHAKNLLANLRRENRERRAELNRLATARKAAAVAALKPELPVSGPGEGSNDVGRG